MIEYLKKGKDSSRLEQLKKILQKRSKKAKKMKWDQFFGKVKFDEDPIKYQRKMRDEW